jgi:hypothetical protein
VGVHRRGEELGVPGLCRGAPRGREAQRVRRPARVHRSDPVGILSDRSGDRTRVLPTCARVRCGVIACGLRRGHRRIGGADDLFRTPGAERDGLRLANRVRILVRALAGSRPMATRGGGIAPRSRGPLSAPERHLRRRPDRHLRGRPALPIRRRSGGRPRQLGFSLRVPRPAYVGRMVSLGLHVCECDVVPRVVPMVGDAPGGPPPNISPR